MLIGIYWAFSVKISHQRSGVLFISVDESWVRGEIKCFPAKAKWRGCSQQTHRSPIPWPDPDSCLTSAWFKHGTWWWVKYLRAFISRGCLQLIGNKLGWCSVSWLLVRLVHASAGQVSSFAKFFSSPCFGLSLWKCMLLSLLLVKLCKKNFYYVGL